MWVIDETMTHNCERWFCYDECVMMMIAVVMIAPVLFLTQHYPTRTVLCVNPVSAAVVGERWEDGWVRRRSTDEKGVKRNR